MSISKIINKFHKNRVESIKRMPNGYERDMAIGAFVADLGQRAITPVANAIGCCFRKIKNCYKQFINGIQIKFEFRGRKTIEQKYPELTSQIKEIVKIYEYTDPHFKTETLFVDLSLENLRNELIIKYNYTEKTCPCKNTLRKILKKLGYKIQKVKKSKVLNKIPETDAIFENVNETKQFISLSDDSVAAISLDDKSRKNIGQFSENGYSWYNRNALDHDTNCKCSVNPFGILDLKTDETFVYCTKGSSTAEFKVDCLEDYLIQKLKNYDLKRLIIFLDNGPENSSRRTLWIKKLIDLSKKYNITVELVYYPPYHSKYNMIERYWARLQLSWSGLIIDTVTKLINTINKVTWKGIKTKATLVEKEYKKGITIDKEEFKTFEKKHVYREESIEKWSLIITP